MKLIRDVGALDNAISELLEENVSCDTETTGLWPYHGDRLFCVILATATEEYYLDFNLGGMPLKYVSHLRDVFNNERKQTYWINAKFDLAMLANEGVFVKSKIVDAPSIARVENNLHTGVKVGEDESLLSMDYLAQYYLNVRKLDIVEKHIEENDLYKLDVFGNKAPDYQRVPLDIMSKYACMDARITYDVCQEISKRIFHGHENLMPTASNEVYLTPVLFDMKRHGLKVDVEYTDRAYKHSLQESENCFKEVREEIGENFNPNSGPQLSKYLTEQGVKLPMTEKGNLKSDKKTVEKFAGHLPIVKKLFTGKQELKKANTYYKNFLKLKDENNIIHCNINQETAITGRCSSSQPNLQNLHKEEDPTPDGYYVRRSFKPVLGNLFFFDYKQQEMFVMVDQAEDMPVIKRLLDGEDFYVSTQHVMNDITGGSFTRKTAKAVALGVAYGQGDKLLAKNLDITVAQAKKFRQGFYKGLPGVESLKERLEKAVRIQGFIVNCFGRKLRIPKKKAYKALNAFVQSSSADVTKRALVEVHRWLTAEGLKSKLCLQVHDEIVVDVVPGEEKILVENIPVIMSEVYPHKHVRLGVDVEWTPNGGSWVDKVVYK